MKKIVVLIYIAVFVNSCSGLTLPRISTYNEGINPIFIPYIKSYRGLIGEGEYQDRFDKLSVNFADIKGTVIGKCWWVLDGDLEVEIDTKYWNNGDFFDKMFLIYHELEHCIRSRLHTDRKLVINNVLDLFEEIAHILGIFEDRGYLKDGCPYSLMHSYTMGSYCRNKHFGYYLDEIHNYNK